jgi:hypothetical protein
VYGIFKKKLNLFKQKYYEKISTALFIFYSRLDFLFSQNQSTAQKTGKEVASALSKKAGAFIDVNAPAYVKPLIV